MIRLYRKSFTDDPFRRFPHGIKHLSDFVHDHGMKLGIYGAVGRKTCMGYPGNAGHIVQDAVRYAEWGVDMFKFDGCFVPLDHLEVWWKDGPLQTLASVLPVLLQRSPDVII